MDEEKSAWAMLGKSAGLTGKTEDVEALKNRIKELEHKSLTSIILEGTRMRVKELGTQIAESRRRRTTLDNMVDF